MQPSDANLADRIALANLILAGFNLLPAFPMDGGRMLRAVLSRMKSEYEATRIATWSGRMLAISMGLYGFIYMPMLAFVAFFIYLGAANEGAASRGRSLTQGIPVRAAMMTEYRTLAHGATIRDAANLLLSTSQQDFPVVLGDQVLGLLGRNALLRGMAQEGPDSYVAGYMEREFPSVPPDKDLADVLPLMAHAGACVLVMEDGTLARLAEFGESFAVPAAAQRWSATRGRLGHAQALLFCFSLSVFWPARKTSSFISRTAVINWCANTKSRTTV